MTGTYIIDEEYSFSSFKKMEEISSEWEAFTASLPIFFSSSYLSAVEAAPPDGMENRYLLVYKSGKLYGILSCQLKAFNADESIKFSSNGSLLGRTGTALKKRFARMINFEGIVCGSVLLTGMYAYHFSDLTHKDAFLLAEKIMLHYRQELNKKGHKIKVTFLKDFYLEESFSNHQIHSSGYKEFSVQPNMILRIRPEWRSYDDYLSSFQSKYRVRARRARKKFSGVVRKELDYVEIRKYNSRIYQLYNNIVEHINFNLFFLHEGYFAELKKRLKNKFRLFAYFKGEEMVAFYTCIDNMDEMNAHFLGYDVKANQEHQLYLNSLYDMVELSLQYNFKTINFSRTAMEIKSSMGAEPFDMLCYLNHKNPLINTVVAKIVDTLNPTEEWVQRNPFKD